MDGRTKDNFSIEAIGRAVQRSLQFSSQEITDEFVALAGGFTPSQTLQAVMSPVDGCGLCGLILHDPLQHHYVAQNNSHGHHLY